MQPLRIEIPGDYWDMQLYRGRLHLWETSGRLRTIDWERLVRECPKAIAGDLPWELAFLSAESLYAQPVLAHAELRSWLVPQFQLAASQSAWVSDDLLDRCVVADQDTPFSELHTDSEVYRRSVYAIGDGGLWRTNLQERRAARPVSSRVTRLWDAPLLTVKAKGGRLALAAGAEGVFEHRIVSGLSDPLSWAQPTGARDGFQQLSTAHAEDVNWNYSSLYSSSHIGGGLLIGFGWERGSADPDWSHLLTSESEEAPVVKVDDDLEDYVFSGSDTKLKLRPYGSFVEAALFPGQQRPEYSWGGGDKIYSIANGRIDSLRFKQSALGKRNDEVVESLGQLTLDHDRRANDSIISGGVGTFGTVLEYERGLTVIGSDETLFRVDEPVTRWRIYSRSINYFNQLHVIMDDRLVIYAFVDDYVSDQRTKRFGARYRAPSARDQ